MQNAPLSLFFSRLRRARRSPWPEPVLLAASFLFFSAPASAQTAAPNCSVPRLRVLVLDSLGTPVSDVNVTLAPATSGAASDGPAVHPTDSDGLAEFPNPPCGPAVLQIQREGFQQVRKQMEIAGQAPLEFRAVLVPQSYSQTVEVRANSPMLTESASSPQGGELRHEDIKFLPYVPSTVADTLAKLPGLMRSADGEMIIEGAAEHHSAFLLNQADVTDPATGRFGLTVPVDVVEAVNVLQTPFSAEYGNFTSGIVTVETRRAAEKWHAELKDPFPEWRIRSTRLAGLRSSTPRVLFSGPVIPGRLTFLEGAQYYLYKEPNKTLPFPLNESKQESVNSYSQFDFFASPRHLVSFSFHLAPQHINYVRPDYFNPQPVTPRYSHHNYRATLSDHLAVGGGTLESIASFQRFDVNIGAQGPADMVMTPSGNRGNYFASQHRDAARAEWRQTWVPAPINRFGSHALKLGVQLNYLRNSGWFSARPIDILDNGGRLLRRIEFSAGSPYQTEDYDTAGLIQDSWTVRPNLTLQMGGRLEGQSIAHSVRFAPRFGFAWSPFGGARTVIRGGYGKFFERVPLDVYAFRNYPRRTITDFDASGVPVSVTNFVNVLGSSSGPGAPAAEGSSSGRFAPRNASWRIGIEHQISPRLTLRLFYDHSRSAGLIDMETFTAAVPTLQLHGAARSRYRQLEVSAKLDWKKGQQFFLTYTHSRAQGHLNDFSAFVGNFPLPVVHQDYFSNLPGDTPNRLLAWGRLNGPFKTFFLPLAEFRNGFPYARLDERQRYVGMPNSGSLRFPNYFSLDNRVVRDVLYRSKYTLRFSLTVFNITDHFNPLAVHANIADPQYGTFFGYYRRRYRADFEILF